MQFRGDPFLGTYLRGQALCWSLQILDVLCPFYR